ncbi:MAG: DNA/RNA nuclease SfsA [Ferroplasma sp.]|uniref:DNA/RNA nuclease SfsA n=1 Tax=Ferroplasma sp. TaxID=2591003 RepID=UPI002815AB47|nr:DNA/RNA nuclease SfsA [Ferroplasma sp.]WMT50790.1 MAG: DNA/RNA nuclease SfsA [Ferroplasma sp.]
MTPFIQRKPGFSVINFPELIDARVISRPNRFLVMASVDGREIPVHMHDPGRLEELIYPGNAIKIRMAQGKKTMYSVTFCRNNNVWTFNDSRFHSNIAALFIKEGFKREVTVGDSRIDFQYERSFIEVKSATLVEDGRALFPDAPTARGKKHLETLMHLIDEGYSSYVLFLIFNENARCFSPNESRDPAFSWAYYRALDYGVKFRFLVFSSDNGSVNFSHTVERCH